VDDGKGRIFPCEGCGADVTFHIGTQRLKCPYCGFQKQIELDPQARVSEQDFHAILVRVRELRDKGPPQEAGQSEVRCEACGGTVVFVGPLTSTECPYCATPIQRENVHTSVHRIPVDGVMPFQIDADVAKQNLVQWVRSRWFAPNDFSRQGVQGKFSGVYLPYWTYDTLTANRYRGERGEHYWVTVGSGKNRRTERRTRWYPASGSFQRFFDDVLVLASRGLNRKYALALEPWPLGLCVPFNQQMLAGFFSRTYEIDLDEGFHEAKARIDAAIADDVRARIGGDEQRIHWIDTQYHALTFKHLLLPAWLMAYRYRDKLYQVMVNAATGEVQGERPYSWIKITLAIVAGIAAAAGIVLAVHLAQS
jgi:DNA-directed RNA polymerase subunit RPC12/RpoP